jgi:CheY-like chemotaxis protein
MDSRTLFARQVRSQCETLCELLACSAGHPVPSQLLERCRVSVRMLAGTMQVVDLDDWARLLASVDTLLSIHGERRLPWDDRIAQLVFELIEKEELLASCHEKDGESGWSSIPAQEVQALINEVELLRQECETADPVQSNAPEGSTDPERLSRVAAELRAACERVMATISAEPWQARTADTITIEDLRRGLGTIEFYAQAMDRIVASVEEAVVTPRRDLAPIETALFDFSRELVRGTGRTLVIRIDTQSAEMEPALLPAAYWILHAMVADIFERCDGPSLEIRIDACERHGALHWTVNDDGENYFSDSRLDHEDQLAFYPGLRHVVRTLREHHGTLAVEPNGGRDARFQFTLPASTQAESLLAWEKGGTAWTVRAAQVIDVIPAQTDTRRGDAYGDFVMADGQRVPLLRLDTIFPEAPAGGSYIAVLGVLEKKVAFYVPGEGTHVAGVVLGDSIPVWKGMPHEVARVDGRRVPLIDAGDILRAYLSITGTLTDDLSNTALNDHDDSGMECETPAREPAPAPGKTAEPEANGSVADVVVIEQSESTRGTLTSILASQGIHASFAGDVDEALELIAARPPRLIISEFRIPTMAAKRIVDQLRESGRDIPVLVTTSQSGSTADLLVEKLGAAGYLSKPLTASQVATQISGYVGALR